MTKNKQENTILLVDMDVLSYRVCVNSEFETPINDIIDDHRAKAIKDGLVRNFITKADASDVKVIWSSVDACIDYINNVMLYYSKEKFPEATQVIGAVTGNENFRKDVLPTYKGNRASNRKPLCLPEVKQFLQEEWDAILEPRLEADDVLTLKATDKSIKGKKIIISVDKDFGQVPNTFWFNPGKDFMPQWVSQKDADYKFYEQLLAGDTVDNYKGCPGIGEATVAKLIDEDMSESEVWKIIVNAFEKKGLKESDALVQARCARLLRNGEYDWDKKEIKLWQPDTG